MCSGEVEIKVKTLFLAVLTLKVQTIGIASHTASKPVWYETWINQWYVNWYVCNINFWFSALELIDNSLKNTKH